MAMFVLVTFESISRVLPEGSEAPLVVAAADLEIGESSIRLAEVNEIGLRDPYFLVHRSWDEGLRERYSYSKMLVGEYGAERVGHITHGQMLAEDGPLPVFSHPDGARGFYDELIRCGITNLFDGSIWKLWREMYETPRPLEDIVRSALILIAGLEEIDSRQEEGRSLPVAGDRLWETLRGKLISVYDCSEWERNKLTDEMTEVKRRLEHVVTNVKERQSGISTELVEDLRAACRLYLR